MKILILSVTTGGGHNIVASALSDVLSACGHTVIRADLFGLCGIPPRLPDFIYRFSITHLRRLYSRTYNRLLTHPKLRNILKAQFTPRWMLAPLKEYLSQLQPDCILSSHVFASLLAGELKTVGACNAPLVSIVTDYCIHPFWEDCSCTDALILPSPLLREDGVRRGIPEQLMLPLGLPLRRDFSASHVENTERSFDGQQCLPTVLLMGGSMGHGRLFRTALALRRRPEFRTVCVCGSNRLLQLTLRPFRNEKLQVLGYVRNLPTYMKSADLAVSKPGGITLSELAACGLPAILFDPIPGHEEFNLRFWAQQGGCIDRSDASCRQIAAAAAALLSDPAEICHMKAAQKQLAFPQSAENLCKFVESLDKA